jgi:hypothetical protein
MTNKILKITTKYLAQAGGYVGYVGYHENGSYEHSYVGGRGFSETKYALQAAKKHAIELEQNWLKTQASTEPTSAGLQYVMDGCQKDRTRGPVQMDMF